MNNRTLICLVITWVLVTLINYYFVNFFFLAFIWIGMTLGLLIATIVQFVKLVKERRSLTKNRIIKVMVVLSLFILTFNKSLPDRIIEKVDWIILKNKRLEIVQKVKNDELKPNVTWNNWVSELPDEYPIVSHGGNDIGIFKNDKTTSITVTFWIFRNFFDSPSTHFIYTNDIDEQRRIEKKIEYDPENNWKIEENWYRTYGE